MRTHKPHFGRSLTAAALAIAVAALLAPAARAQQSTLSGIIEQMQLTSFLADKLMLANQADIELSKIAEQRSTNADVKLFAQRLIADHKQFNDKLAELSPRTSHQFATSEGNSLTVFEVRTAARDDTAHDALTTLCRINHKAAKLQLDKARKMLAEYQGQDFDMAFLGLQIGQHAWLLSELQALEGVGSSQFQDAVAEAQQHVAHHLKDAQALAKQLEDDRETES